MTSKDYNKLTDAVSPPSPLKRNLLMAFLIGGGICAFGEALVHLYLSLGAEDKMASTLCSVTLVLLTALLTGLNVFDNIAKVAGAGTLVPITGFANAITSPALEFKSEGLIIGLGAKMFIIAGPVIIYGIGTSALCGLVLWLLGFAK